MEAEQTTGADDVTDGGTALCATHAGAQSTGSCERCGNFVCPLCLDEYSALPEHCEACREREGGGLIAFEREEGSLWRRWWQTTKDVLFRPSATFESTRPGSATAATAYVALVGLANALVVFAFGMCGVGMVMAGGGFSEFADQTQTSEISDSSVLGLLLGAGIFYILLMPVMLIVLASVRTGVFHLTAWALDGDGGLHSSYWSMSYLQATGVIWIPLTVTRFIPVLGALISVVAMIGIEVFYAIQLTTVARRYHNLSDGRATLAGWSFFILGVSIFSCCCLIGMNTLSNF